MHALMFAVEIGVKPQQPEVYDIKGLRAGIIK
jgi:hypothetical protein